MDFTTEPDLEVVSLGEDEIPDVSENDLPLAHKVLYLNFLLNNIFSFIALCIANEFFLTAF
jgi:hypothetical protein